MRVRMTGLPSLAHFCSQIPSFESIYRGYVASYPRLYAKPLTVWQIYIYRREHTSHTSHTILCVNPLAVTRQA